MIAVVNITRPMVYGLNCTVVLVVYEYHYNLEPIQTLDPPAIIFTRARRREGYSSQFVCLCVCVLPHNPCEYLIVKTHH